MLKRKMFRTIAVVLVAVLGLTSISSAQEPVPLVQYTFDEASSGTTPALNTGTLGAAGDATFYGTSTRVANTPDGYSVGSA